MSRYIDKELKYCPQCDEEYRADIIKCADCGTELISGAQLLATQAEAKEEQVSRDMNIGPEDELTDVRKGPVREMKQTQALLKKLGIPSLVVSGKDCGKGCCGPDVLLQVRSSDIPEVLAVFAREYQNSTALHEHDLSHSNAVFNVKAEETTCPACGFSFSTQATTCPDCGLCFG